MALIIFSHGKESGPEATKIKALREIAEQRGHITRAPDYRGIADPMTRVELLCQQINDKHSHLPLILMGSSMGSFVSIEAARQLELGHQIAPVGLFLLAPAVYMTGYPASPPPPNDCLTWLVHGWQDDIVPVDNALLYARTHRCELTLIDDDHRLSQSIEYLKSAWHHFLTRLT